MAFWDKLFSSKKEAGFIDKTDAINIGQGNDDMSETKIFIPAHKVKPVKQPLPAILKVVAGPDKGKEIDLGSKQVNIGRLPDSELLLSDTGVSRLHAFIINEDGCHVVCDGKSMNGTYLNGQRITQKVLQHGDSIKVANTVVVYELS